MRRMSGIEKRALSRGNESLAVREPILLGESCKKFKDFIFAKAKVCDGAEDAEANPVTSRGVDAPPERNVNRSRTRGGSSDNSTGGEIDSRGGEIADDALEPAELQPAELESEAEIGHDLIEFGSTRTRFSSEDDGIDGWAGDPGRLIRQGVSGRVIACRKTRPRGKMHFAANKRRNWASWDSRSHDRVLPCRWASGNSTSHNPVLRGRQRANRRLSRLSATAGSAALIQRSFPSKLRLKFILIVSGLIFWASWQFPATSRAETHDPWLVHETALSTETGDQVSPSFDGDNVVYLDRGTPGSESLMRKNFGGDIAEQLLLSEGFWAGPAAADGGVAWQTPAGDGCLRPAGGGADRCISAPEASSIALSGSKAVISDSGSTIRLLDFDTMRSRMLDSYDMPNMRYDPDIEKNTVVWVKERGYAGKYYEPLITAYDLATGTSTYLTKTGGGEAPGGGSRYLRRNPSISNGRVAYQQKTNEPGEKWHIFLADSDTFGDVAVQESGDQINPSLSGNLLVYQDNRGGYFDTDGNWVDDWNIYLKDLSTGIEQPVCVTAGDQINPVIKDNKIVWQDNRNGGWDIYGAELIAPPAQPELSLSVDSVRWDSLQEYASRELTVVYGLANEGAGPAEDVSLANMSTSPGEVNWLSNTPETIATMVPGAFQEVAMRYYVPEGILWFRTSLQARCKDGAGTDLLFPAREPDQ